MAVLWYTSLWNEASLFPWVVLFVQPHRSQLALRVRRFSQLLRILPGTFSTLGITWAMFSTCHGILFVRSLCHNDISALFADVLPSLLNKAALHYLWAKQMLLGAFCTWSVNLLTVGLQNINFDWLACTAWHCQELLEDKTINVWVFVCLFVFLAPNSPHYLSEIQRIGISYNRGWVHFRLTAFFLTQHWSIVGTALYRYFARGPQHGYLIQHSDDGVTVHWLGHPKKDCYRWNSACYLGWITRVWKTAPPGGQINLFPLVHTFPGLPMLSLSPVSLELICCC